MVLEQFGIAEYNLSITSMDNSPLNIIMPGFLDYRAILNTVFGIN